jgi:hypothetical protein
MTTIPDIKSTYKTWFTWASLTPAQQAFATSQGYLSGSVSVAIGDVVDYVTQTVASTQTLLVDANGDPICNYGFNGVANVTFPAALAHTLTGTVDTANKTLVNNTTTNANAYASPLTLTNSTGEKRIFLINVTATADMDTNSGVTADTVTRMSLTSTLPFVDGTTQSWIGLDNEIKTAPTALNTDSFRAESSNSIILNNGQSTNLNILVSWYFTSLIGSTANSNGRIGYCNFSIISVPAE